MKNCFLLSLFLTPGIVFSQVGIGTITPGSMLHVVDTTGNILKLTNTKPLNGNKAGILFQSGLIYTGAINTFGTGLNSARLAFSTFASINSSSLIERLSIVDNGNVGIGNVYPVYKLDVNGGTHVTGGLIVDGNTGIGVANPSAKLDINGSIKLTGNITKTGTGTSLMLPYAYGKIADNSTIISGTGNFTVSPVSEGRYALKLNDDPNLSANKNLYIIMVTLADYGFGSISYEIGNENLILVRTSSYSPSEYNVLAYRPFDFIIYRVQ